jgi:aspartate aminotransferase
MYAPDLVRRIARVVEESLSIAPNLVILSDEIYEKITYGPDPHFSIGSIPEVAERTITVNGLSKAFAMTGWRAGYAACPGRFGADLIKAMGKLQGQMTSNITSFVYPAIRVALTECESHVEAMRAAFARRAELMHAGLEELGLACPKPMGAFYAFPDVSPLFGRTSREGKPLRSAHDIAEALIDEAGLACIPGEGFGGCGQNHLRLSFACSEGQIAEGLKRLEAFLAAAPAPSC